MIRTPEALIPYVFALAAVLGGMAWHLGDQVGGLGRTIVTGEASIGGPFHLTDQNGATYTDRNLRGHWSLLYFGYTFCPDVCPTTLLNLTMMLKSLGKDADAVRVLFVTVDPGRDTLSVLNEYTKAFAPQVVGLRGTPDQLATLAKRYRVSYSVSPAANGQPYEVTHGAAVYLFNRAGNIKLLFSGLALAKTDTAPELADLRTLIAESDNGGWWHRLLGLL